MEPPSSSSVGEEEDVEQTMGGSEQSIDAEENKNLASLEATLPNRECRICYAPEGASGADPILPLGCACKDDISNGHQSCLKKWFRMRFLRYGTLDCEVCRNPLGDNLKQIVRSFITSEVIQHAPRFLLLLQVPPADLDHLQVPLETPGFYQLPSEMRRSLEASFERLAQEQRRGQSRRREAFEPPQRVEIAAADADVDQEQDEDGDHLNRFPLDDADVDQEQDDDDIDHLNRFPLEDMLLNDIVELMEAHEIVLDPPVLRVFVEHPHSHIRILDETEGVEEARIPNYLRIGYPEAAVVRVPILGPADRVHPTPAEVLLDEVSRQAVRFVDLYGEDLILLPNRMDSYYLEAHEPLLMSPIIREEAPPTEPIPRRVFTYGRFQMFQLFGQGLQ